MAFEAELRAYLENLRDASAEHVMFNRRIDEHALRAHFLERLRGLEATRGGLAIEPKFRAWSPQIVRFAHHIEALPPTAAPIEGAAALVFATRALDVAIGLTADELGVVERLEFERIIDEFRSSALQEIPKEIESYAVATNLVRGEVLVDRRLTPLGTAFLRLRGEDAIRWLLTVDVVQSNGRADPWRVSRELLEAAMSRTGIFRGHHDDKFPFDANILERLGDMGVLTWAIGDDGVVYRFDVAGHWRDGIRAVLVTGPWHQAIGAILTEEDRTGLVPTTKTATEAVIEQAKMIAHEVRNALVPVRHHIDALRGVTPESQMRRIDAVKRGVVRVLTFVEEMVGTSELIAETAMPCDLQVVVREALGWIDGSERVEISSAADLRVRAPRLQLTRAVSNVLRNALQATKEPEPVRATILRAGGGVRIVIDDGGPGIPDDQRERVFHEGFTTRSEGSGYGLAYVRRVVAEGLRGRVWCEASDLGGARFVIELPVIESER